MARTEGVLQKGCMLNLLTLPAGSGSMPQITQQDAVVRFGVFEADLRSGELRKSGVKVKVQDLPFRALSLLLTRPNEVLSRDDFRKALWPDGVFVDFDHGISSAINRLRDALGDSADRPVFIETVERRGYRWIAPIRTESAAQMPDQTARQDLAEHSTSAGTGSRPFSWRSKWIWVFPLLAVLLVAWGFRPEHREAKASARTPASPDSIPLRSVAVLPLQNFSNDPSQEYFVDGMTDELITDLAQIKELKVVSRTSIMQYKGTHSSLPQIGRELGVDAVVEGSVLRSGDRVRITAQLIRAATDRHIWAQSYDGDLKDVFALQARVAQAITNEVKLNLTSEESGRLQVAHSVDPEAFDLYLRGRYAWNERSVDGLQRAIEFFKQAVHKDPNFAMAYAGLADSHTLMALNEADSNDMAQGRAAAEQAIALDDTLAEAHTSLAASRILLDWDWKGAEVEFRRALKLNPNLAYAHHWYANLLLSAQGRHDEAIAEMKRAQELDPLSPIIATDLGFAYYLAGKNDQALETYAKVEASYPDFVPVHRYLAKYYNQVGQYDLAIKENIAAYRLVPSVARTLQQIYDRGGYRAVWEATTDRRRTPHDKNLPADPCSASTANLLLGRNQQALDGLDNCYRNSRQTLLYLKVDPDWSRLRSEPRYRELLQRLHLE